MFRSEIQESPLGAIYTAKIVKSPQVKERATSHKAYRRKAIGLLILLLIYIFYQKETHSVPTGNANIALFFKYNELILDCIINLEKTPVQYTWNTFQLLRHAYPVLP